MFAIPYVFIMIVIVLSGQLADYLRVREILSTTAVRKLQTIIGNLTYRVTVPPSDSVHR